MKCGFLVGIRSKVPAEKKSEKIHKKGLDRRHSFLISSLHRKPTKTTCFHIPFMINLEVINKNGTMNVQWWGEGKNPSLAHQVY